LEHSAPVMGLGTASRLSKRRVPHLKETGAADDDSAVVIVRPPQPVYSQIDHYRLLFGEIICVVIVCWNVAAAVKRHDERVSSHDENVDMPFLKRVLHLGRKPEPEIQVQDRLARLKLLAIALTISIVIVSLLTCGDLVALSLRAKKRR